MEILLLNLPRSADRREFMDRQFKALGLTYTIVSGGDAQNFTPAERAQYEEGVTKGIHRLRPGQFGASLAHIRACEYMLAHGLERALVLEDDAIIAPELLRILQETWLTEDWWDMVHIGYGVAGWQQFVAWLKASWTMTRQRPFFAFYALLKLPYIALLYTFEAVRNRIRAHYAPAPVRFFRPVYHGRGYFLTKAGAQKIMSIAYPIRYEGDTLYNQARIRAKLRFYGYCPPPVSGSEHAQNSLVVAASA
jgi:glycosyl transferase family 25